jgi:hypothetical protein
MARYKIDCCKPDCPERSGTCHGTCKRYKEQRRELDETNAELNKKNNIKNGLDTQKCNNIERIYKRCNINGR